MPRLVWIGLGLLAGIFARSIAGKSGRNVLFDIALGLVGAIFGGWLFSQFGASNVAEFSQSSILVEVIGAAALLVLFQAITSSAQ